MKLIHKPLAILVILLLLGACGGGGGGVTVSDNQNGTTDEWDITGVYTKDILYRVYSASGPCGLTVGDHSGDDVIVMRNRENNVSIAFGIPGHFWTEVPATYYEQIDAAGIEYVYTATGAMLEGGDWTNAPFTIEGKFEGGERGSAWAHVSINGDKCTAELNFWSKKE